MKFNLLVIMVVISAVILFQVEQPYMAFGIIAIGVFLLVLGVFDIRLQFFVPQIKHQKRVLLTFDDGPVPGKTEAILDVLLKENIKAIFFLIGKQVSAHPNIVKRIVQEGHAIGNHTHSHNKAFTFCSTHKCLEEINKCSDTIQVVTGVKPTLFRPPFGITNPQIGRAVKASGLDTLGWTVRSLDTVTSEVKTIDRLKRKTRSNSVVLLHDSGSLTVQGLRGFIEHCKTQGLLFSDVDIYKTGYNA